MKRKPARPLLDAVVAAGSLFVATCGVAAAQPAAPDPAPAGAVPPSPAPPDRSAEVVPLAGAVEAFNVNPDGLPESAMLKLSDGRTAQVNFPPHLGAAFRDRAPAGGAVKLDVLPEPGMPDHPVYSLVALHAEKGDLRTPRPEDRTPAHVEGTVTRLNFGRRGEANGLVLDTGDVVRIPPDQVAALKIVVGSKVSADGDARAMLDGRKSVDATTVNGSTVRRPPPPPPGRGPREPRPPEPR